MYGETFYGRHTAQHQLQWRKIEIKKNEYKLRSILHDLVVSGTLNPKHHRHLN